MLNSLISTDSLPCFFHRAALCIALFYLPLFSGQLAGQASLPFCEGFESGSLNPAYWMATPSVQGIVAAVAESPHEGSYALKLGKFTDTGGFQTQKADLRFNLQGYDSKQVELTFWILDYYDDTQVEDGLFFSKDGGANFTKVLDFKPSDWCDNLYGQFPPIDVDELARKAFGQNWSSGNFVVRFQQHGTGDFFGSADGFYLDDICLYEAPKAYFPVRPDAMGQKHHFFDDFETCSLSKYWAWRFADKTNTLAQIPTRPSNYVAVEHGAGFDSECGVVFGKRCDDGISAYATNALDLHLDLAGQLQVALTFWYNDYYDETQQDDGIYFSNDGGATFKKVLDFKPSDYCDNQWGRFPPIDVDELAFAAFGANWATGQFIVRFQQHDESDFFGSADGMTLDDVNVYIDERQYYPVYANHPFEEDFETGGFRQMWAQRWANQTNTLATIPTRPSNYIAVESGSGFNGSQYAAAFGKRCDDGVFSFVTNALDLYLDLAGQPQVEMTFWIRDYYDDTQKDDAIFFSDDGGLHFKRAFSLNPSDWCDNQWGQFPPFDLDEMAQNMGLNLTKNFVVRFQQHGTGDFFGSADGWYIDNLSVYVPPTEHVPVPFFEDFETGPFGKAWARRFAEPINPLTLPTVTRPSNLLEVNSGIGHNSEYGVGFGKRCDDGFATNALNLHLNLTEASGVKLSFDLLDYYDDTHSLDAILFSDDGGKTYKKVYEFNFGNIPDNVWQTAWPNPPFNVDALAAAQGLKFNEKFIIRFQQHDDGDSFGSADGIIIDNVNLSAAKPTTSAIAPSATARPSISPNPATNLVRIVWPEAQPNGEKIIWRLFDSQGKLVQNGLSTIGDNDLSIDLSGMEPGVATLQIVSGGQVWQERVVKQR